MFTWTEMALEPKWLWTKVFLLVIPQLSMHLWSRILPFQEDVLVLYRSLSNRIVHQVETAR